MRQKSRDNEKAKVAIKTERRVQGHRLGTGLETERHKEKEGDRAEVLYAYPAVGAVVAAGWRSG